MLADQQYSPKDQDMPRWATEGTSQIVLNSEVLVADP